MIWLTWRQFRTQTLTAVGGLAVLTVGLLALGLAMRHTYDTTIVGCAALKNCDTVTQDFNDAYGTAVALLGAAIFIVPALLGAFWGAPLITRELETGTHRLVWTQSVTRRRWLAVKLAGVALAALVVSAAFSLLLTWAASPSDTLRGNRFGALEFGARNLAPVGYAVFALLLGTTIGMLVKRTLPAMAVTIVVLAIVQAGMALGVRSHLLPPVTESVAVTPASMAKVHGLGLQGSPPDADGNVDPRNRIVVQEYEMPGAWILTPTMELKGADGNRLNAQQARPCFDGGGPRRAGECLAKLNAHFDVTYQPASRYWPFQWIEASVLLAMALALAGFGLWRIPRGIA